MVTARDIYEELSRDYMPNTKRPELGKLSELKLFGDKDLVHFVLNWYDEFDVQFNPKTVKVRYALVNKQTNEKKRFNKQIPLETECLLDVILDYYLSESSK